MTNIVIEGYDTDGRIVQRQEIVAEQYRDVTTGQAEAVASRMQYLIANMYKDPLIKAIQVYKK